MNCGTCAFFFSFGESFEGGHCRRYPPKAMAIARASVGETVETVWPEVKRKMFCGEYKAK